MTTNATQRAVETNDQYSLAKIFGLWVAAALPMALLGWVVHPALAVNVDPLGSAVIRMILMTAGLVEERPRISSRLRVATKFTNVAKKYLEPLV